jgi:hypothetical protein
MKVKLLTLLTLLTISLTAGIPTTSARALIDGGGASVPVAPVVIPTPTRTPTPTPTPTHIVIPTPITNLWLIAPLKVINYFATTISGVIKTITTPTPVVIPTPTPTPTPTPPINNTNTREDRTPIITTPTPVVIPTPTPTPTPTPPINNTNTREDRTPIITTPTPVVTTTATTTTTAPAVPNWKTLYEAEKAAFKATQDAYNAMKAALSAATRDAWNASRNTFSAASKSFKDVLNTAKTNTSTTKSSSTQDDSVTSTVTTDGDRLVNVTDKESATFTVNWVAANISNWNVSGPGLKISGGVIGNTPLQLKSDPITMPSGTYTYTITGIDSSGKSSSKLATIIISALPTTQPLTHLACDVSNACTSVPGVGVNQCATNADCFIQQPTPPPIQDNNSINGTNGTNGTGGAAQLNACSNDIKADPILLILPNQTSTLTWDCSNQARNCTISSSNPKMADISVLPSGSIKSPAIPSTTTFTLTCPDMNSSSVRVRVLNSYILKEVSPQ